MLKILFFQNSNIFDRYYSLNLYMLEKYCTPKIPQNNDKGLYKKISRHVRNMHMMLGNLYYSNQV
jgi:hypothetical protein